MSQPKHPGLSGTAAARVASARDLVAASDAGDAVLAAHLGVAVGNPNLYPLLAGTAMGTVRQLLGVIDGLTGEQS